MLDDFGAVDILVHAAGIASRGASVVKTDPDELDRVLRTHALAAHHLCRLLVPRMRKRPRGDVVFISSVAARLLAANGAPYNMAKAALEALAMTLAKEERAPRYPRQRGRPRPGRHRDGPAAGEGGHGDRRHLHARRHAPRSAGCAGPRTWPGWSRFLCSEEAGYVTGQVIGVTGGA